MNLTLPIEPGRRYVRRDGAQVTARDGGFVSLVFVGDGPVSEDTGEYAYRHTGTIVWGGAFQHPHDLVSDA